VRGVELVGVRAGYGGTRDDALREMTLHVEPGELAVVLGPNGAGKSTLVRVVAGLLPTRAGRVHLFGQDLATLERREVARIVSIVPQSSEVAFGFTVREVVAMGRAPHQGAWQRTSDRDHELVARALLACDLEALAGRRVDELSGGEQKLVAIARALAQDGRVLLLDEVGAHLDVRHLVAVHELIRREVAARDLACIAVMHDLNAAARYADRVLLLSAGRLVAAGPPSEVMTGERLGEVFETELVTAEVDGAPCFLPRRNFESASRRAR
jgi:iron complex transport system ATP-binding protein